MAAVGFVFFRQGADKASAEAFEDAVLFGNFYQTRAQGRSGDGEDKAESDDTEVPHNREVLGKGIILSRNDQCYQRQR